MHRDKAPCCLVDCKAVWGLTAGGEIILREGEKWKIAIAYVLQKNVLYKYFRGLHVYLSQIERDNFGT
jgi:hypothetical protein